MHHFVAQSIDRFQSIQHRLEVELLRAPYVEVETWHAQDVTGNPDLVSREMTHVILEIPIPHLVSDLNVYVKPNQPWAEKHFQERVGGEPLNPPPSESEWPFAVQGNAAHKGDGKFSHTYPERYWPKRANAGEFMVFQSGLEPDMNVGIRFPYGDLNDVLVQLKHHPLTRQAYLPVWFPEDTGAIFHQRVPCSLGYHFLQRDGKIDVDYFIRSCDIVRHFPDDVYMTMRLVQWICERLGNGSEPGLLVMHVGSLHMFQGDVPIIENKHRNQNIKVVKQANTNKLLEGLGQ